jgi:hypothetical protein
MKRRIAALLMVVGFMLATAAPVFAQNSGAEDQYSGAENQYAPPAGQNPGGGTPQPDGNGGTGGSDSGLIEAPQPDGNGGTGVSDADIIEALSNTIKAVSGSGEDSATCEARGAWGGLFGWPEGCFTGPDEMVIPGSTPGSASDTGLVPSDQDSFVIPGYDQDPAVAYPGWGMDAPFDPCDIINTSSQGGSVDCLAALKGLLGRT